MYYVLPLSLTVIIIILKVVIISLSGLVVTYLFAGFVQRGVGGGSRQSIFAFLKQQLGPLQSHLHQHLVNSITALGASELQQEAKLSLG